MGSVSQTIGPTAPNRLGQVCVMVMVMVMVTVTVTVTVMVIIHHEAECAGWLAGPRPHMRFGICPSYHRSPVKFSMRCKNYRLPHGRRPSTVDHEQHFFGYQFYMYSQFTSVFFLKMGDSYRTLDLAE